MNRMHSSLGGTVLGALALVLALVAGPAVAQIPQTITIDGVNDFDPANLLENDGGDTEESNFCADDPEVDTPMDIKAVYVTNDANNLYIGFEYDRECFNSPQVNLGIAFSYGAAGDGGTTDPFSRKIAWNTIADKPDNVVYAVIDGFNYEVFYEWNGSGWTAVQDGSDGLGMANDTGFEELAIPLAWFDGLAAEDDLKIELWMTQDGTTKPPLDAVASDDVQTSTAGGTTFDVNTDPIEMSGYLTYTIIDATDNEAPLVTGMQLVDGDRTSLRVAFNESLDPTTGAAPASYLVDGVAPTAAVLDGASAVVLTLAGPLAGNASLYEVDLQGVEDLAGNAATAAYDLAVKDVIFEGLFGPFLETNATGPTDFFTVEGSRSPLDFGPAQGDDEMSLFDAEDDIYRLTVPFSWYVGPTAGSQITPSITVEWKFAFNLGYEGGSNQILPLAAGDDASTLVSRYWEDLDPTQFTGNDIDVIFELDTNALGVQGGDTIEIAGSVAPLSFSSPYTAMVDDGSGQDAAAGDGIYTVVVTFPAGSLKNVNYKFVFNANLECFGQGDRTIFLNDEAFDTIGGTLGPLVLPTATFDRCTVLAGPADVVFSVEIRDPTFNPPLPSVYLTGSVEPLSFDLGLKRRGAPVQMFDDGVAPDATAGDKIYTTSVTFPDSSSRFLEYKYVVGSQFEGEGLPNRQVTLNDAGGSPQVLGTDIMNQTIPTGTGDTPLRGDRLAVKAMPNPFNPTTTVVFEMPSRADVTLDIFDARGRHVRALHSGSLAAGTHSRVWDGRADDGRTVASGVYFASVRGGGFASAVRLVLVK